MDNSSQPLFRQIAALIEDSIVDGTLSEGAQAPSTNELAEFHNINPATARKGIALLVELGVLEKKRGIGMFVAVGAAEAIRERRRAEFAGQFVAPLVDEAARLGYSRHQLLELVRRVAESRGLYA
ncbi:GntR family transcriptional regulator [Corynebacterium phocae]|uniref:GntR family transcriptional regulator n=1 Tax=Corynebacterium phocae TaxID=161895 RepID=A0A1L7D5P2_9CORY|nr:GntR family transcriptional regulator [Corynebacterium phocae]APT93459.1 GntR family transcriptional regulator [Corynebacterium phocae]KAA8721019.1 GntR family transcriptional regulator [Corynebacterium phocae]